MRTEKTGRERVRKLGDEVEGGERAGGRERGVKAKREGGFSERNRRRVIEGVLKGRGSKRRGDIERRVWEGGGKQRRVSWTREGKEGEEKTWKEEGER